MRRRLCLLALPLLFSATGCNSPGYFEAVQPSTRQRAVVYLYRPEATTPGLMKPLRYDYPDLQIDGQSIGTLKYNKHRWAGQGPAGTACVSPGSARLPSGSHETLPTHSPSTRVRSST